MGEVFDFPQRDGMPHSDDPLLPLALEQLKNLLSSPDVIDRGPEFMQRLLYLMVITALHGIQTFGDDVEALRLLKMAKASIKENPNFSHSMFEAIGMMWVELGIN